MKFPLASIKVQTMMDVPLVVYGNAVGVVPVIVPPEQLSVVVGATRLIAHWDVSGVNVGLTGASLSVTVMLTEQLALFPSASMAVNLTVVIPAG